MATYKVIQDIEAEDKFLGPLTLKQFIFGAVGVFFGWLNFFAYAKGFPWAMIVFGPPMLLGFFMAIPWSKDQPTEVWVLAKLRFKFKPKKRIWDQDGMQELVTITAPKKVEKHLTNELSQGEVHSRLKALADTIDSRGWAVKNATLDMALSTPGGDDRLVSPNAFAPSVPTVNQADAPDMFESSSVSANFDQMIEEKTKELKQHNLNKLDRLRSGEPLETIHKTPTQFTPPVENTVRPTEVAKISPEEEKALAEALEETKSSSNIAYEHMHTIGKRKKHKKDPQEEKPQASTVTTATPAIMNLAQNDDLDVATIARQAKKEKEHDDEVVVSLH